MKQAADCVSIAKDEYVRKSRYEARKLAFFGMTHVLKIWLRML